MSNEPHVIANRDVKLNEGWEQAVAAMLDSLLRLYVLNSRDALPSLTLSQSQPMGPFGTDSNSQDAAKAGVFLQMSNRLKVLANLNPVRYQEPVEATLTVTVEDGATGEPRNEKLRLYFDDRAPDPFCRIELDQAS